MPEPVKPALPAGTPLLARSEQAAQIFGMSISTLYRLRQRYADFGALTIKTGREVLYDVPRCYDWLSTWLGNELRAE